MRKKITAFNFCAFLCFWLICQGVLLQADDAVSKNDAKEMTSRQVGSFDNPVAWDGKSNLPLSYTKSIANKTISNAETSLSSEA